MAEKDPVQELKQEEKELEGQVVQAGKEAENQAREQGLSEEQVNERVQKARKEEKDKLYPKLEEVQTALKEVQETLKAEREDKAKIKKDAETRAEQERQESLSEAEKQLERLRKLEEQLNEERKARIKHEQDLTQAYNQQRLDRYREKVLQAANGEIIAELVRGNTEEEIDSAAQIAKARYAEVVEKAKEEARKQFQRGLSTAGPDYEAFEEEELNNQIGNIDGERYRKDAEYREKILSMAAQTYQRSGGRR